MRALSNGFSSDGSLKKIINAQTAVLVNEEESTSFAIKYHNSTLLLGFYRRDSLQSPTPSYIFNLPRNLLSFVGAQGDCQAALRKAKDYGNQYRKNYGEHVEAPILAMNIADEAHICSLLSGRRPLAANCLLIGYDSYDSKASSIYKVDVSGNYFKSVAIAVGKYCEEINAWLRSRGLELARRMERYTYSGNDTSGGEITHTNFTESLALEMEYGYENATESRSHFLYNVSTTVEHDNPLEVDRNATRINSKIPNKKRNMFKLAWRCLLDAVGKSKLSNYRIEVAVATTTEAGRRVVTG